MLNYFATYLSMWMNIVSTYLNGENVEFNVCMINFQVDHGPFVEYVQKYFVDIKPTWHYEFEDSDTFQPNVDQSIAQYIGSIEQVTSM